MKYFLWLTLPLLVLDQVTKLSILKHFPDPRVTPFGQQRVIPVIDGFFDLVRVHNTGMAFGGFSSLENSNVVFCGIALVALVVLTVLWRRGAFPGPLTKVAAALLVAGVLGNLIDRIAHNYVVDFLDFYWKTHHWPSFNVADSCITVAACLLFISAFTTPQESNRKRTL
ncbi:MAG: signal peptidase II [Verrucomicrobiales bacterium]